MFVDVDEQTLFTLYYLAKLMNLNWIKCSWKVKRKNGNLASFAMAFPVGPFLAASLAPSQMNL